jgi:uncharacterized membrane protein
MRQKETFGNKLADLIAKFGGSWYFIIFFVLFMGIWIGINLKMTKPFDEYPFILLNLMLSCLAALQAPVIMMSQNRQEAKDRKRNEEDFATNKKAEREIRQLIAHVKALHTHLDVKPHSFPEDED